MEIEEEFDAFLREDIPTDPVLEKQWEQRALDLLRKGGPPVFSMWKEYVCREATVQKTYEEKSPSGLFFLKITVHPSPISNRTAFSRGQVFNKDGDMIAVVFRNYGRFPFAWVEGHPQGDFLLCGEDYQGMTLVNLQNGIVRHKLAANADKGGGFCWSQIYPSPQGTRLAVHGCVWACPYETVFYDFSSPESMDWPILRRHDRDVKGWKEDGTCDLVRSWDVVHLPGHPLHGRSEYDLTLADLDEHSLECHRRGWDMDDVEEDGWVVHEDILNVNSDGVTGGQ
jgi:hypothetical protein